jgi:hypothetical protein
MVHQANTVITLMDFFTIESKNVPHLKASPIPTPPSTPPMRSDYGKEGGKNSEWSDF